ERSTLSSPRGPGAALCLSLVSLPAHSLRGRPLHPRAGACPAAGRCGSSGVSPPVPYAFYAPAMTDILALVEARLRSALGEPDARAAVTFLGTERIEVLRFSDGDLLRYATLGMSAQPMNDPADLVGDPVRGPRAELVLSVRAGQADTDK